MSEIKKGQEMETWERRIATAVCLANCEDSGDVEKVIQPFIAEMRQAFEQSIKAFTALNRLEPDWRLSLGDGVTVAVKFSDTPRKSHLSAFVKVFGAMAESYVEKDGPEASTNGKPAPHAGELSE